MKELQTSNEWHHLLEQSKEIPYLLLKHSTTCPVSATAYRELEAFTTDLPKYFIKIQDNRALSNEIESDLGIRHESPQLFLLKEGRGVWQATHYAIRKPNISKAMEEHGIV